MCYTARERALSSYMVLLLPGFFCVEMEARNFRTGLRDKGMTEFHFEYDIGIAGETRTLNMHMLFYLK
jgi:hypothetical protein